MHPFHTLLRLTGSAAPVTVPVRAQSGNIAVGATEAVFGAQTQLVDYDHTWPYTPAENTGSRVTFPEGSKVRREAEKGN
eukprot:1193315-Prorocentrum_minimum.AAC.4